MKKISHLDEKGNLKMIDITNKSASRRMASASGKISMNKETILLVQNDKLPKGSVLEVAKVAGIQAAKQTSNLIPLCHSLNITWINLDFEIQEDCIQIYSIAKTKESTGLEMEALTAVSVAALTIYDMVKSVDKSMVISDIHLVEKRGGKSDSHTDFSPKTALLILSQSVHEGKSEDSSGPILKKGLSSYGCRIEYTKVIPDDSLKLQAVIEELVSNGFDLIVTSGGTGVGPYDVTIDTIKPMLTKKLQGVEQALHSYGQKNIATAMLSRLLVGSIENTFIICLPGSPGAAKDAISVLMPSFLHVFPMSKGNRH